MEVELEVVARGSKQDGLCNILFANKALDSFVRFRFLGNGVAGESSRWLFIACDYSSPEKMD